MITLISTPEYSDPVSPSIISRWLATESANNFRLHRNDFAVNSEDNNSGKLNVVITAYLGSVHDIISVYDQTTNSMYVGTVTNISGTTISTDINFVTGMNILYLNDNTIYAGYYFEGRLTVNGIIEALTIAASPDSFGYADINVSGVLSLKTAIGKDGDYSSLIMKETTKSGKFTLEYRARFYGDNYDNILSPPIDQGWIEEGNTWYYAEAVRSEEQGSNLHKYVISSINDAPFFNEFDQPVYFKGLPFDLSFILPEIPLVSNLTVTMIIYNSSNTKLGADVVTVVPVDSLDGLVNSLNLDILVVPEGADHMTIEINV